MAKAYIQRGATDPNKGYVGQVRDNSLQSYLHEAFKVLEMRFANFDHDGAQTLMYSELENELAMVGFLDGEKLTEMFKRVDFDGNGTLDFSEFLALLYVFSVEKGSLDTFFRHPANAELIKSAFQNMSNAMVSASRFCAFCRMPACILSVLFALSLRWSGSALNEVFAEKVRQGQS